MREIIKREQTCCFTGHRPEKLPWGTDETEPRCLELKRRIQVVVELAYEEGIRRFLCGMARGCDFYFAEAVIALRHQYPDVELFAVLPCLTQSHYWPHNDKVRWRSLLNACDKEILIQERYTRGCMLRRNRYMVDHSLMLIAAFCGQEGGTYQTVEYALQKKEEYALQNRVFRFVDLNIDSMD